MKKIFFAFCLLYSANGHAMSASLQKLAALAAGAVPVTISGAYYYEKTNKALREKLTQEGCMQSDIREELDKIDSLRPHLVGALFGAAVPPYNDRGFG